MSAQIAPWVAAGPGPRISVCYTSARPSLVPRQVEEWLDRAHDVEAVEFVVTIDAALAGYRDTLSALPRTRVFVNRARPCCVDGWNLAARKARGDILVQCSDDLHPSTAWDVSIRSRLQDGAATAVLAVSDGFTARADFLPHAIVTRKYYNRFGYLFHDAYWSMWSDNEFSAVARQNCAVVQALDIVFNHAHGQIHDEVKARHEASLHTDGITTLQLREQNAFRPWKMGGFAEASNDSDGIYCPYWNVRPASYWKQPTRSADFYLDLHRESAARRAATFGPAPPATDLQVLIAATTEHRAFLDLLTAELDRQRVPYLIDDRSGVATASKRNDLIARSTAPYVTFFDDDDWLAHDYGEVVADAIAGSRHEADVILHDVLVTVDHETPRACYFSSEHPPEDTPECFLRRPNHLMVWRRDIATKERFAPTTSMDGAPWCERIGHQVVRSVRVRGLLRFVELPPLATRQWLDRRRLELRLTAGAQLGEWLKIAPNGLVYPWFTHPFLDEIGTWDLSDKVILELGAGRSTAWWRSKARWVDSIEADEGSARQVEHGCRTVELHNGAIFSRAVTEEDGQDTSPLYLGLIPEGRRYDIVVVDGVWRDECLRWALEHFDGRRGIIIANNWQQDFVWLSPEAEALMAPWSIHRHVQPNHTNHEGRPWNTSYWRIDMTHPAPS